MLACVLAVALATAAPSPAASAAIGGPLSPGKIFANARLEMYLHAYPRYIAYIVDVQSNAYGKHYHEGYRELFRSDDSALVVKRAPIYTSNQPINPYGFSFFGLNKEGDPKDHIEPPFGVPLMSAIYDFGLARPPVTRANAAAEAAAAAVSTVPVIGHVAVNSGDYDVTLLGEETLDSHDVYHLALTPQRDPDRNRVREVWVDTKTFDVWKLVTNGIFPGSPAANAPWTITYINLHGRWLIRTESTTATFSSHPHLFGGPTQYQGVNYTFGAYEFPNLISDLEFVGPQIETDAIQM